MKDKLFKHGKKKSYFVMRNILFISLAMLLAGSAIAIPVSISYVANQNHITQSNR